MVVLVVRQLRCGNPLIVFEHEPYDLCVCSHGLCGVLGGVGVCVWLGRSGADS